MRTRVRGVLLRRLMVVIAAGVIVLVVGGLDARGAATNTGAGMGSSPSASDKQMRRDLDQLADAWMLGGGRFGYPFWEKAMQRWRSGELSTALFREYVTGYRDRLRSGCSLLSATRVDSDAAQDVRSLLTDSCSRRLDALQAQQQWLEALIDSSVARRTAMTSAGEVEDSATRADEVQRLAGIVTKQQAEYADAIDESYRDTRLAMDLAQGELDQAGMQRLPEDAFI